MGATMAPTLASIVVAHYEEQHLATLQQQPLLEKRYIDDVLTIWLYSKKEFLEFFHNLNLVHPNLKFTMEISYISIVLLDLTISKGIDFL